MQSKTVRLTALAAILVSGAALTQVIAPPGGASGSTNSTPTPNSMGADYTRMDRDKDGALSKMETENNQELTKQWDTLDVNQDGKLDEAEFAQFESESMSNDTMDDLHKDYHDDINKDYNRN